LPRRSPNPCEAAFESIEYIVWHDALIELAGMLNGRMINHRAAPPGAPKLFRGRESKHLSD